MLEKNGCEENGGYKIQKPYKSKFGLSFRGMQARILNKEPSDWVYFMKGICDKYCSRTNPDGYLSMFLAENAFMNGEIKEKISKINKECEWPDWVL